MIPLHPAGTRRSTPWLTWSLIVVNLIVAGVTLATPFGAGIMATWAVRPTTLLSSPLSLFGIPTLVTSVFLHAGWLHLFGNMIYLAAFGPLVEDRLGRGRMLALYLAAGALGMLVQALAFPGADTAIVGASGAIAGVLGASLLLAHRSLVTTAVPAWVTIEIAELPAGFLVVVWIVIQLAAMRSASTLEGGSVAYVAHLAGIATGVVVALLFTLGRKRSS